MPQWPFGMTQTLFLTSRLQDAVSARSFEPCALRALASCLRLGVSRRECVRSPLVAPSQNDDKFIAVIFRILERVKVFRKGDAGAIGIFANAEGFKAGGGVLGNHECYGFGDFGVADVLDVSFLCVHVCVSFIVWYVMIIAYTIKQSQVFSINSTPLFYGVSSPVTRPPGSG